MTSEPSAERRLEQNKQRRDERAAAYSDDKTQALRAERRGGEGSRRIAGGHRLISE